MRSQRCTYRLLILLALALVAVVGCARTSILTRDLIGLSGDQTASSDEESSGKDELPTKQAAEACLTTARELEENGHHREAILLYERALTHRPNLPGVAHHLAVLYDLQGQPDRAAVEYRKALAQSPEDADLLNDAGYFHLRRNELGEAETHLRRAVEADPQHEQAWTNLGMVLGRQGRHTESVAAFAHATTEAAANSNVGVILAQQGDYDEARSFLHKSLALDPNLKQPKACLAVLDKLTARPEDTTKPMSKVTALPDHSRD